MGRGQRDPDPAQQGAACSKRSMQSMTCGAAGAARRDSPSPPSMHSVFMSHTMATATAAQRPKRIQKQKGVASSTVSSSRPKKTAGARAGGRASGGGE